MYYILCRPKYTTYVGRRRKEESETTELQTPILKRKIPKIYAGGAADRTRGYSQSTAPWL